jgi:hypothetical protein
MGVNKIMTPLAGRNTRKTLFNNSNECRSLGGTYDGTATTIASRNDAGLATSERWNVLSLWDGYIDAGCYPRVTPQNYKAGSSIKVYLDWGCSVTGNAYVKVGLSRVGTDGVLGDDTDTEYIGWTTYNQATVDGIVSTEFTFSGTGITPGMPLVFIVMRDGISASDTIADYFDVHNVRWEFKTDKL